MIYRVIIIVLVSAMSITAFSQTTVSDKNQEAEVLLFFQVDDAKSLVAQKFFDDNEIDFFVYDISDQANYAQMMNYLELSGRYSGGTLDLPVIVVITNERTWIYFDIPNLSRSLKAIEQSVK